MIIQAKQLSDIKGIEVPDAREYNIGIELGKHEVYARITRYSSLFDSVPFYLVTITFVGRDFYHSGSFTTTRLDNMDLQLIRIIGGIIAEKGIKI